jgi:hypothetical protein
MKFSHPSQLHYALFLVVILFFTSSCIVFDLFPPLRIIASVPNKATETWESLHPNATIDEQWDNPEGTPVGRPTQEFWEAERCNAMDQIVIEMVVKDQFDSSSTYYCSQNIKIKNISPTLTIRFFILTHQKSHNASGAKDEKMWGGATLKPGESATMPYDLFSYYKDQTISNYFWPEQLVGLVESPECSWIQEEDYPLIAELPRQGVCPWP